MRPKIYSKVRHQGGGEVLIMEDVFDSNMYAKLAIIFRFVKT